MGILVVGCENKIQNHFYELVNPMISIALSSAVDTTEAFLGRLPAMYIVEGDFGFDTHRRERTMGKVGSHSQINANHSHKASAMVAKVVPY